MNILFIGMNFYNYDTKITEELTRMGHKVTHITDAPDIYAFPARFTPQNVLRKEWLNHQRKELDNIKDKKYELIFVTVGRHLFQETLISLRKNNPDARFILYLWDDVARVDNFENVKKFYDVIFSIDPEDCINNSFIFLPLFFTNEFYKDKETKLKFDVYSAMADHSDRVNIVKKLCKDNPSAKFLFYILLSKPEYIKSKLEKKNDSRINYIAKPVPKDKNREYLTASKALLDIPYQGQKGLTIRTFECIQCGIKLITTNKSIRYYDFFSENSIYIIDRANPHLDMNFLDSSFDIPDFIVEKYSLHNWLNTILCEKQENFLKEGHKLQDLAEA